MVAIVPNKDVRLSSLENSAKEYNATLLSKNTCSFYLHMMYIAQSRKPSKHLYELHPLYKESWEYLKPFIIKQNLFMATKQNLFLSTVGIGPVVWMRGLENDNNNNVGILQRLLHQNAMSCPQHQMVATCHQ